MNRSKLPVIYLIATFIIMTAALLFASAQLIAYFKSGAEMEKINLLDPVAVGAHYQPIMEWHDLENEGREMEPKTLKKMTKDYIAGYYHQYEAFNSESKQGIHDYFTDLPREHIYDLIKGAEKNHETVEATSIEHHAELEFYAEDGTIITMTDQIISYQRFTKDSTSLATYDTAAFQVMLLLEDNFWRVRHRVRVPSDLDNLDEVGGSTERPPMTTGENLLVDEQPFHVRGLNYYSQSLPWQKMWEEFAIDTVISDFKKIQTSGFNTVRVFIPFEHFGGANVNPEELEKVIQVLDMAHAHNLKVIITLFDFFWGYAVNQWTLSDRHAQKVIGRLKDHPALLAWDVKNEPDLDFEGSGQTNVEEWLKFMIHRIKGYDPNHMVTIGWSQPERLPILQDQLDFLSFHYYRDPLILGDILGGMDLKKPLFLGETGMHTFSKWWYPFKRSPEDQADFYKEIFKVVRDHKLHYALWTLYDFDKVPSSVAGRWPWKKGPQKSYGLIDGQGNHKPAYEIIKTYNLKLNNNEKEH